MRRLLALLLLLPPIATAETEREYRYADAHLHYVDFFQETEGPEALAEAMAEAGVEHVVLMGVALTKKWSETEPRRPRFYQGDDAPLYWYSLTDVLVAEGVQRLPEDLRARVHPFISGFNPNDKNAVAHIERMLALYPGLWAGIGEVFTRHDDLTALTHGEAPRANSEAMMRVYRLAAERGLPVNLHANLTSVRERRPIYRAEIEEALSQNPDTRIILAHAGTSAGINRFQGELPWLLPTLRELLQAHDNLSIDLSWSVLEHMLDADGEPRAEWLQLLRDYPDRFVLGSDLLGRFGRLGERMDAYRPLLDALPEDIAHGIARDNLLRLIGKEA